MGFDCINSYSLYLLWILIRPLPEVSLHINFLESRSILCAILPSVVHHIAK